MVVRHWFISLWRWNILLLLLSIGNLCNSNAQTPVLNFKHITDEQGLSNTSVEVIFPDSRGFVWIGTRNGLNRYDGYDIRTYFHQANDPNSLIDGSPKLVMIGCIELPQTLLR